MSIVATTLAVAAAAAQPPAAGALPAATDALPIPSPEAHSIIARCRGRDVVVRYTINRPGPDLFTEISVGGVPLAAERIALLNGMLGGYMLDSVSLYSCDGDGDRYELKIHLLFSRGEERHIYLIGIRNGQLRLIR